jgi:hypothetical protein
MFYYVLNWQEKGILLEATINVSIRWKFNHTQGESAPRFKELNWGKLQPEPTPEFVSECQFPEIGTRPKHTRARLPTASSSQSQKLWNVLEIKDLPDGWIKNCYMRQGIQETSPLFTSWKTNMIFNWVTESIDIPLGEKQTSDASYARNYLQDRGWSMTPGEMCLRDIPMSEHGMPIGATPLCTLEESWDLPLQREQTE